MKVSFEKFSKCFHEEILERLREFHYSVWLVVPLCCLAFYLFVFASDQYEASAVVYVQAADDSASISPAMGLLGVSSGGGVSDAHVVKAYIESLDMLLHLDNAFHVREHYASKDFDFVSRLVRNASQEEALHFYRDKLVINYDDSSKLISISIKAYDAHVAHALLEEIVSRSEWFINETSHKVANEELEFSRAEMSRAYKQLNRAIGDLHEFQSNNKIYSTKVDESLVLENISYLKKMLLEKSAEFEAMSSYMNNTSSEVKLLETEIKALNQRLEAEARELVSESSVSLNQLDVEFKSLELQINFQRDIYIAARKSLEKSQLEAKKKLKYLQVVEAPIVPEEALYPRRLYWFFTMTILFSLVFFILKMLVVTIQENSEM